MILLESDKLAFVKPGKAQVKVELHLSIDIKIDLMSRSFIMHYPY